MSVKLKIKKGDTVIVRAGRDKGKTGEVLSVSPKDNRCIVQGVNLVKRHQKQTQTAQGGIITKEASIDVSNVGLVDAESGKATRVGYKFDGETKVRVAKRSGAVVE